ncbi:hypothetical protein AB836_00830 [Rickettsiales bacterium (ex Bugula neritina AB1)]|nr:hypothetical protein AB836_00830 [Rickettsiales bacterium (ex Bugula neritina AB1)]
MIKFLIVVKNNSDNLFLGQTVEKQGTIIELLGNMRFKVELDEDVVQFFSKKIITCKLSGKMFTRHIRIILGDRVKVQITIYDNLIGRIMLRL